mmetsp:Transcript_139505/g.242663  ORF Transcript_139505/g.242663 Transcript_139505/m.242663 type:complete len:263 (-) Transcript_139505:105-893(-)
MTWSAGYWAPPDLRSSRTGTCLTVRTSREVYWPRDRTWGISGVRSRKPPLRAQECPQAVVQEQRPAELCSRGLQPRHPEGDSPCSGCQVVVEVSLAARLVHSHRPGPHVPPLLGALCRVPALSLCWAPLLSVCRIPVLRHASPQHQWPPERHMELAQHREGGLRGGHRQGPCHRPQLCRDPGLYQQEGVWGTAWDPLGVQGLWRPSYQRVLQAGGWGMTHLRPLSQYGLQGLVHSFGTPPHMLQPEAYHCPCPWRGARADWV